MLIVPPEPSTRLIFEGLPFFAGRFRGALEYILDAAKTSAEGEPCVFNFVNVHSFIEARSNAAHENALANAVLNFPDGAPIAAMLSHFARKTEKVSGPDILEALLSLAEDRGFTVAFWGGSEATCKSLLAKTSSAHPRLTVFGAHSPAFAAVGTLSIEDSDKEAFELLRKADLFFVGLGCPKQEAWMAEHGSRVRGACLGIGAAFDFFTDSLQRAPDWMQRNGLEWLFRLASEPRRLFKRYFVTNSLFLLYWIRLSLTLRFSL